MSAKFIPYLLVYCTLTIYAALGQPRVKRFGPPGTFEDTSGRDDFGGSMGWNLRTEGVRLADVDMVTPVVYRDPLFRDKFGIRSGFSTIPYKRAHQPLIIPAQSFEPKLRTQFQQPIEFRPAPFPPQPDPLYPEQVPRRTRYYIELIPSDNVNSSVFTLMPSYATLPFRGGLRYVLEARPPMVFDSKPSFSLVPIPPQESDFKRFSEVELKPPPEPKPDLVKVSEPSSTSHEKPPYDRPPLPDSQPRNVDPPASYGRPPPYEDFSPTETVPTPPPEPFLPKPYKQTTPKPVNSYAVGQEYSTPIPVPPSTQGTYSKMREPVPHYGFSKAQ